MMQNAYVIFANVISNSTPIWNVLYAKAYYVMQNVLNFIYIIYIWVVGLD